MEELKWMVSKSLGNESKQLVWIILFLLHRKPFKFSISQQHLKSKISEKEAENPRLL